MRIRFITQEQSRIDAVHQFIEEWNSDSKTIKVLTSGSTGAPKEIELSKEAMLASAKMTCDFLGLNKTNSALLCLSMDTIAGKMMVVRSLFLGMQLIVTDVKSNPLDNLNIDFDFTAMVPMQIEKTIEHASSVLKENQKIIIGGGPISNQLESHIQQQAPTFYHTYGMTETITHVAMRNISNKDRSFKALPGVRFETINNCLVINANHVGITGLKTTDVVEKQSDTAFIWKGRSDFVINSGGIKLHPEEIEHKLESLIPSLFFCAGIQDDQFGQKHVICIESKRFSISKEDFKRILEPFSIPKEIYWFSSFSYTKSDKIDRLKTLKTIPDAEKQVL
jgi:O-succinylbenzoic acid--CoA ligase